MKKEHGEVKIGAPVSMDKVPEPTGGRGGRWLEIYDTKVASLKKGQALPMTFSSRGRGLKVRTALRKAAEKRGERLSSSWDAAGTTFYFWIESE